MINMQINMGTPAVYSCLYILIILYIGDSEGSALRLAAIHPKFLPVTEQWTNQSFLHHYKNDSVLSLLTCNEAVPDVKTEKPMSLQVTETKLKLSVHGGSPQVNVETGRVASGVNHPTGNSSDGEKDRCISMCRWCRTSIRTRTATLCIRDCTQPGSNPEARDACEITVRNILVPNDCYGMCRRCRVIFDPHMAGLCSYDCTHPGSHPNERQSCAIAVTTQLLGTSDHPQNENLQLET